MQPGLLVQQLIDDIVVEGGIGTILHQSLLFSVKNYHEYVLPAQDAQLYRFLYETALSLAVSDVLAIWVCYLDQLVDLGLNASPSLGLVFFLRLLHCVSNYYLSTIIK